MKEEVTLRGKYTTWKVWVIKNEKPIIVKTERTTIKDAKTIVAEMLGVSPVSIVGLCAFEEENMNTLKNRLCIYKAEMQNEIENEDGCFDELAKIAFTLCLSSNELLDDSSRDRLIQLDCSVYDDDLHVLVDGIFLCSSNDNIHFTCTRKDNEEICDFSLYYMPRQTLLLVLNEVIKMC